MVRRECCIPGLVAAFIASVLLVLATVSLPLTWSASTPFSVVNAYNFDPTLIDLTPGANQARLIDAASFGVWGYCTKGIEESSERYCSRGQGHAYEVTLRPSGNLDNAAFAQTSIQPSWTRGLVIVVVSFVFSIVALALSAVPHLTVTLVAAVLHLLTFLLSLIAFIVNIVMFIYTRNRVQQVSPGATVMPGVAFYLLLISLPFSFVAGLTVCCGRREKPDKYEYKSDYAAGGTTTTAGSGGGLLGRFKRRRANNSTATYGTAGGDNIPMDSRAKVLSAFNESKA